MPMAVFNSAILLAKPLIVAISAFKLLCTSFREAKGRICRRGPATEASVSVPETAYGYTPRQDEGRYFARMVVPAAKSPHFQPSTVLPPSVPAATAVP
jgi:hypothetical protein